MAQWSRADRTLYTKLVYYGPAFGGKTTNLESLHRITDPEQKHQLLSLQTVNDRTLFFELLPFELGDILGYQLAMKVYTVPGQVRYDTTRQVVLAGADAVVFVADSSADRREQNTWSLQNLKLNMRAKGLDPKRVPVLFQFNKQDLPEAAPAQQVASWLNIPATRGVPAVAVDGRGVLETLTQACGLMLRRLVEHADRRTRQEIDVEELDAQLERAFTPHFARLERGVGPVPPPLASVSGLGANPPVLEGEQLLERSVETSVQLGDRLTTESARAERLEREADAFRQLSDSLRTVGASFDRTRIVDAALGTVQQILEAPVVSLVKECERGRVQLLRGWSNQDDPLFGFEEGRSLLARLISADVACQVDDLESECGREAAPARLEGLRGLVSVPVSLDGGRGALVAYARASEGPLGAGDLRFLSTVAGHLAAGLEKARLHEQLAARRDALEDAVAARTAQLRQAYRSLREMAGIKDRFLANLSHEMKTPLTAILSAANVVRDFDSDPRERRELLNSVIESAEMLDRQLDDLFRLVSLESGAGSLELDEVQPGRLVQDAIQLSGRSGVQYTVDPLPGPLRSDRDGLARALANLIDNAAKFSPSTSLVRVRVEAGRLPASPNEVDAMVVDVIDRGAGVAERDRQRIFQPFEQGGDGVTGKPRGIGLGLYEARLMARRHGGEIECRPRDGGGSVFRLVVPLEPAVDPSLESGAPTLEVTHV